MPIRIVEESVDFLARYAGVSISFPVDSVYDLEPRGIVELNAVQPKLVAPYEKDYDAYPDEGPGSWAGRFDLKNWAVLAAYDGVDRIGGAAVAWNTRDVEMLEARRDLACLWDIRVDPSRRGKGIGRLLFERAAGWARERGCTELKIETQNTNVAACRFYAARGCELREVNDGIYPPELNELQLLWYLKL